jgi:hypothetical protein
MEKKRTKRHRNSDGNSPILKQCHHPKAAEEDFIILARNCRKICEAMFTRDIKPTLNKQRNYIWTLFKYMTSMKPLTYWLN